MVNLSSNNSNNVRVSAGGQRNINVNSPTDNNINANNNGNSQRARSWAIGEGLIDGEDYSAKYWAEQAKISEEIARESIDAENNAHIWAEGTDEEVEAIGGTHSSKGWVDYVIENAPTASVEETEQGAVLTVTDINGTTTATIYNGADGQDGQDGAPGQDGRDGTDGADGQDGQDGFSPIATVSKSGNTATISITDANGTTTTTITDGTNGTNGTDGQDGEDGFSPTATVTKSGNTATITITDKNGTTTANVYDGTGGGGSWGNITGDIADQSDLQVVLDDKQDVLTAGTDLEIVQGSILPNSYTQLTSITSTGTQWINSGIKLTNNFKSIIVGRLTGTPTTNFRTILGANNNNLSQGKQNVLLGWGNSANGFYAEPCIMPSYTYSSYPWDTNTHTFTTNVTSAVTTLDIDGVVDTISSAPSITGVNLAIFARLAQNGTVGSQVNFELNSIELYQSGSLVFKGVPAKRNSDDEVGLYDTVSGSFCPNLGTGDFVAGSEVPAITVINFTNESGYIKGINSTDVTTALGYTPVNPSNLATVATSGDYDDLINKPTIPTVGDGTITITQGGVTKGTFTTNQSGNATIALDAGGSGGGGIQNTATGTDSLTILGTPSTGDSCINIGLNSQTSYDAAIAIGAEYDVDNGAIASDYSVAIGTGAVASASYSVAIGAKSSATNVSGTGIAIGSNSLASGADSIALGNFAEATAREAYQIGEGTNNTANSFQVENRQLLDITTGLIPDARLSSNIARTSQIPAAISDLTDDTATTPIDKAESVVDNNSGSLNFWSGTKAQYDAIVTKDANTLYNITDDANPTLSMLELLYPVGSIYIGTMSACPLQTLGVGTWQLVAADKVLQGAGTRGDVGDTINESLPNIKGNIEASQGSTGATSGGMGVFRVTNGAFTGTANYQKCPAANTTGWAGSASNLSIGQISLNASRSSSTYQDDAPVQQDAYVVNIWERIS